jgi:hypothetical protein
VVVVVGGEEKVKVEHPVMSMGEGTADARLQRLEL